ncbi:Hypothetical protein ETEE_2945 [Edwardsiella anguillarum ET080813]|uniref:Uncharacterized protein n=1 Tax=Edwardsiella anguillarum ET080813 TaxID=667120 RepID=A0A076LN73_9GAMM|nr:Hypothetical protein ETEE_2945 [Edwardsiella anguillarum ET080813]
MPDLHHSRRIAPFWCRRRSAAHAIPRGRRDLSPAFWIGMTFAHNFCE